MDEKESNIVNGFEHKCLHYEHKEGSPYPHNYASCMGCSYCYAPELIYSGCFHPQGFKANPAVFNVKFSTQEKESFSNEKTA